MPKFLPRRLRVFVIAGAAGFGAWHFLPTSPVLRAVDAAGFRMAVRSFANPPFFISGTGGREAPWEVRLLASRNVKNADYLPTVVRVPDDPDGVFQSSPPSPVDYAVIFRNLHRLGTRHLAVGAVMAWENPDPIARTALDSRMDLFDSLVTVSPLARGITAEPMPAAFVRASLPVGKITGDVEALPLVNRLPLPGTVLGDQRSLAGFSDLETEPKGGSEPLLARWGDRVVFAFPLVAVLAERNLPVEGVEVRLGSLIKLGPEGPVIPIDERGCMKAGNAPASAPTETIMTILEAESLADAESVLLRDDRGVARMGEDSFSVRVSGMMAAIRSEAGLSAPTVAPRLDFRAEIVALAAWVVLLTVASGRSNFGVRTLFVIAVGGVLAVQILGVAWAKAWLPGLPALCAVLGGVLAAWPFGGAVARSLPPQKENADSAENQPAEDHPFREPPPQPKKNDQAPPTGIRKNLPGTSTAKPAKQTAKKTARKTPRKAAKKKRGPSPESPSSGP